MNNTLQRNIENWKFKSALQYMENATDSEQVIIKALADTFHDCGWFDGNMGIIVNAAVQVLLEDE